jgi:glycyl-tRNA synthetase beta subunit
MFTRILTAKERRRIQAYIDADGERTSAIRTIVTRANQVLPSIEKDLQLLKELLEHYEAAKVKKARIG